MAGVDERGNIVVMRGLASLLIIAIYLVSGGCCRPYDTSEPTRPEKVQGWNTSKNGTILIVGSFILNKGESTENAKFGVKLIDLTPRIICSGPLAEPSPGKIKLRFYRTSDKQVLCDTTISAIGISGAGNLDCLDNPELPPGYAVRAINYKQGWVWLELTATVGDSRW